MSELEAIALGKWSVGYDHLSGQAVLMMEFADRPPLAVVMPMDQVPLISMALNNLSRPGGPAARKN